MPSHIGFKEPKQPGYQGAVVTDTDKIRLADASDPFVALWKSDSAGPWYLVLATPDTFASGQGPAAAQPDPGGSG